MDAVAQACIVSEAVAPNPKTLTSPRLLLLTALWFGAIAGGFELAVVLIQSFVDPRISMDMLRRNRHYVWMIPLANMLIFAIVGFLTAVLARIRPRAANWLAWRISIALTALALLLNIEGLYAIASATLALGIAAIAAPWIERRAARLVRIARHSLPVLGGALIVLTALWYGRVTSAEERALAALPSARPGLPNVLLIVLDDVRASSMSLYGRARPTTPNLERLARRGVLFSHARPTASWTLPSHASMFTGMWPYSLSVGWDRPLDSTYPTLAETLSRAGYATAGFVGNTYYGNALYGLGRGFARYEDNYENEAVSIFELIRSSSVGKRILQSLGYSMHVAQGGTSLRKSAAMINRDILGWIDNQREDRPFFAFLNYYDAHSPFQPPGNEGPRFGYGAIPGRQQVEILKRLHRLQTSTLLPGDGAPETIEREATAVWRDSYESCIAYLDRQIGVLFDELERRGLLDETLVIITSDHGEHLKERGFCGHGLSLYRPEVHVPLVIIPPTGAAAGRTVAAPVSLRDLAATTIDLVGLGGSQRFPGQSLARFWQADGAESAVATPLLAEVDHQTNHAPASNVPASLGAVKSVVADGKVYIRNGDGREELYDLIADPLEVNNLAGAEEHRVSLAKLRRTLDRMLAVPESESVADRRNTP